MNSTERKIHPNTLKSLQQPIIQWTLSGQYIRKWDSLTEAAKELELDQSHITKCCQFKRQSHGGYKWSYGLGS